jgi:hypothetical protein
MASVFRACPHYFWHTVVSILSSPHRYSKYTYAFASVTLSLCFTTRAQDRLTIATTATHHLLDLATTIDTHYQHMTMEGDTHLEQCGPPTIILLLQRRHRLIVIMVRMVNIHMDRLGPSTFTLPL